MLRIKSFLLLVFLMQNFVSSGQFSQGFLDSISTYTLTSTGVTIYPINFNDIKVSESMLVEMNKAHYEAFVQSKLVNQLIHLSKKNVKKSELELTMRDLIDHSPNLLISLLNVHVFDMKMNDGYDSDYSKLTSIDLIATNIIYDVSTGKQVHSSVLNISPDLSKFNNRIEQNNEICRIMNEEIKKSLIARFPIYSNIVDVSLDEKNKAVSIGVNTLFHINTQKKDLFVNKLKETYILDNKKYYRYQTIGKIEFFKQTYGKVVQYKISRGGKDIALCKDQNEPLFLSTHLFEW